MDDIRPPFPKVCASCFWCRQLHRTRDFEELVCIHKTVMDRWNAVITVNALGTCRYFKEEE